MKRCIILAFLPLFFTGCGLTRIVTVAPDHYSPSTYSTVVTVPRTRTVTTTTRVVPASSDISLCLDLQAVGAAFAQSSTVQEFENLLNNSSYMLSNLDLNGDGYVDYLRVMETVRGYAHVFLIQAVLAPNVYQDVATVVAEVNGYVNTHVQIIGSSYIYGPNYIVQPVFVVTPAIYAHLMRPSYSPWRSPWYWNHYPSCYRRPAPIYYSHYHAYVDTFMRNHRYCHEVSYAKSCHYPDYVRVCSSDQRNDYGQQHPEQAFSVRNAEIATSPRTPSSSVRSATSSTVNARTILDNQESSAKTTVSTTGRGSSSASPSRSATSSTSSTPARSAVSSSSTPSRSATTSTSSTPARSATSSTTVSSRVRSSGSSNTRISTVSPSGAKTTTSRTQSSSSPSRSSSSSSTGRGSSSSSPARR